MLWPADVRRSDWSCLCRLHICNLATSDHQLPMGRIRTAHYELFGKKGVHTVWALEVQVHDVLRVQEGQPACNVQRDVLAQARQPMRCSVHPQAQFVKGAAAWCRSGEVGRVSGGRGRNVAAGAVAEACRGLCSKGLHVERRFERSSMAGQTHLLHHMSSPLTSLSSAALRLPRGSSCRRDGSEDISSMGSATWRACQNELSWGTRPGHMQLPSGVPCALPVRMMAGGEVASHLHSHREQGCS